VNKKEAAEFLGLSEKTVERYKSSGKLSARMKRVNGNDGKSRTILDFNQSDLERLKRELSGNVVFPEVTDRHGQTKTQTDTDRQTEADKLTVASDVVNSISQTQTDSFFEAMFKTFEAVSERNLQTANTFQKLMLTIDEASEVSGLPKAFIERAIKKEATMKATKIGGRYRIKRQDLDEFINSL
jgi:excisionase family DNA binding protein